MKIFGKKVNSSALLCGGLLLSSLGSASLAGLAIGGAIATSLFGASTLLSFTPEEQKTTPHYLLFIDDTQEQNQGVWTKLGAVSRLSESVYAAFSTAKGLIRHSNKLCEITIASRSGQQPSKTFNFQGDVEVSWNKLYLYLHENYVCSARFTCGRINKPPEDKGDFNDAFHRFLKNTGESQESFNQICGFSYSEIIELQGNPSCPWFEHAPNSTPLLGCNIHPIGYYYSSAYQLEG